MVGWSIGQERMTVSWKNEMIGIVWCLLQAGPDPKMGRTLCNLGERIMPWFLGCGVYQPYKTTAAVSIFSSFFSFFCTFSIFSSTFHYLPLQLTINYHVRRPLHSLWSKRPLLNVSLYWQVERLWLWVSDRHPGHGPFLFTHSFASINTLGCVPRNQILLIDRARQLSNIA
jgi:hypothetical protein